MSGENPYAPPETTSTGMPNAPESFGWELVGNRVWAEKIAQFPMIDPYSGESNDVMTMNRLTVRLRPNWQLALSIILVGTFLVSLLLPIGRELKPSLAIGSLISLLLVVVGGMFYPVSTLNIFCVKRTVRIHAIQEYAIRTIYLLGLGLSVKIRNSRSLSDFLGASWIPMAMLVIWLLVLIWRNLLQRRLTCRRRKDGRFEIRGFHPKALDQLRNPK